MEVNLLEHKKLPKFIGRVRYFKLDATPRQKQKIDELRENIRKFKIPTKSECQELCDIIERRILEGELTYGDNPIKRAKAITDVIGYNYAGLSGLVVGIAQILEQRR